MRIFATKFTVIGRCDYSIADTDLFSVDLVVALGGDVECLFLRLFLYPAIATRVSTFRFKCSIIVRQYTFQYTSSIFGRLIKSIIV